MLSFVARVLIGSEEWRRAWRRESRLLARVRRAAWRREMAELERTWAIASAHADGVSLRKIAAAAGLGPTRVHAIVRDADLTVSTLRWVSCAPCTAGPPRRIPTAAAMMSSPGAS
jgi:hypothetical protein